MGPAYSQEHREVTYLSQVGMYTIGRPLCDSVSCLLRGDLLEPTKTRAKARARARVRAGAIELRTMARVTHLHPLKSVCFAASDED